VLEVFFFEILYGKVRQEGLKKGRAGEKQSTGNAAAVNQRAFAWGRYISLTL
jgi:hypothetical protein